MNEINDMTPDMTLLTLFCYKYTNADSKICQYIHHHKKIC